MLVMPKVPGRIAATRSTQNPYPSSVIVSARGSAVSVRSTDVHRPCTTAFRTRLADDPKQRRGAVGSYPYGPVQVGLDLDSVAPSELVRKLLQGLHERLIQRP